jgi:hypothetical protein
MMKNSSSHIIAFLILSHASFSVAEAQRWEIRRLEGGLLQVRADTGLNLIIRPEQGAVIPERLKPQTSFVLGTEFDRTVLRIDGTPPSRPSREDAGEPLPPGVVAVEPVLIGVKRAGIELKTDGLKIVFASVDLMSDQGWITTHRDQDIDLLVLTFRDAARLMTARMNLWVSLVKTRQILLNPTGDMPDGAAREFSNSIGNRGAMPIDTQSVLKLPQSGLKYGDRKVISLRKAG